MGSERSENQRNDDRQSMRPAPRQDETAELRQLVAKLQARLDALEAKPENRPAIDPIPTVTARLDASTKTEQKIRQMQKVADDAIALLRNGPKQYRVSLTGEPRLTQIVGAISEGDADLKFRRYHGIRAIVDTEKRIIVETAEEAAVV